MFQIQKRGEFRQKLAALINEHCLDNDSDTPDFVLAEHLTRSLESLNATIVRREQWYGRKTGELGKGEGDCLARHNDLFCNLPPGHEGSHQALGNGGVVLESWDD